MDFHPLKKNLNQFWFPEIPTDLGPVTHWHWEIPWLTSWSSTCRHNYCSGINTFSLCCTVIVAAFICFLQTWWRWIRPVKTSFFWQLWPVLDDDFPMHCIARCALKIFVKVYQYYTIFISWFSFPIREPGVDGNLESSSQKYYSSH